MQKINKDGFLVKKADGVKTTEIVIRSPKSTTLRRDIRLFDELWEGLMTYRRRQKEMMEAFDTDYDDKGYIFCNSMGKVFDPKVFEALFKRALKAAGLEGINFHELRHTFATRALEAGMDVKVLSSIPGHAQASTTLNLLCSRLTGSQTGQHGKNERILYRFICTNRITDSNTKNARLPFDTNGFWR